MMAVTSILLLIAPVVFFAMAMRSDVRQPATVRLLAIVYGLPAIVLVVYSLMWRVPATRILIELHGIAFRMDGITSIRKEVKERTPGGGRVLIGESSVRQRRATTSLFGTLVYGKRKLTIELPPPEKRSGVIATQTAGFLGALDLEENDQLCIDETCWTFADDAFTNGQTFPIPPRQARLPGLDVGVPLPFARPIPANVRTYALDPLARRSAEAERVRSFVAFTRHSRRPRLVPLDANVTLRRGGKIVTAPQKFDIADGERVSFHTLPAESPEFVAPPVVERRSAIYRAGDRSFALDFDTPEIHSLTTSEFDALRLDHANRKVVPLAMGDAQLVDKSLYFSGASESVALQASALVQLSRFFPRDFDSAMRILTPRGPTDGSVGAPAWIGATDLASIRMLVLRPPLLLLLLALAMQFLKVWAAASARFTIGQAMFAGALELLVAARLLFGHRVWSMPPHKLEGAELAFVAWVMLPWIFLAASLPAIPWRELQRTKPPAWMTTLAGLALSMAFCATVVEGPRKYVWLLCHVLALTVPFWSAAAGAAALRMKSGSSAAALPNFLWIAVGFCVFRIILLLFGFKESAMLPGGRISISAIYVPAACILEGLFLAQVARVRGKHLRDALLIILFVWLIPALLTSDVGLALLNIPVFVLLLLAVDPPNRVLRAIAVAILLFVAGAPLLRLALPLIGSEERLLALASEANYARFLHFAAPERLQALATKRGESLAITSAILQPYVSSGIFGRGYGRSEVSTHLGDTALRDFAPAVFVAAEWGLVGTMAMIVTYMLFAFLAWRLIAPGLKRASAGAFIVAAAALTITLASVYMILANHELVLLTGKNAYLLGLDSAGDVLETFALLLLIAFGSRPS